MAQRDDLRSEQTDRIYRCIGRFVVEFSQLIHTLGSGIRQLVGPDSIQIVVAELDAVQLVRCFFALCGYLNEWGDDDRALVRALRTETDDLLKDRNKLAHEFWIVGWGNEHTTDWSRAQRIKTRAARYGMDIEPTEWTAERIDQLADDVARVREVLGVMTTTCNPIWAETLGGRSPRDVLMVDENKRVWSPRAPHYGKPRTD